MNKKTLIGLLLLAACARETVAQSTLTAAQLVQERQRIELERKQVFDLNNPASKAKKGAMPNSADIEREMRRVDRERKQMFDANNPATKNLFKVF